MKESDILYERGDYFVLKAKHGFEVYKNGLTHSTRCAIIGYLGAKGMQKSIEEIDRRMKKETTYLDEPFQGSIGWSTVMTSTKEQLQVRRPFVEGAIRFHTKNENAGQVKFFTEQLELIDKRLKKFK